MKSYIANHAWPDQTSIDVYDSYIDTLTIDHGTISVRFGNQASPSVTGHIFSLRPSLTSTGAVLWACGYAEPEGKDSPFGPAGVSMTNIPKRFLRWRCR